MSLIRWTLIAMLSALLPGSVLAQLFTDQGMMGGSGLTLFPTATSAPASEMQVQYSRVSFLSASPERANIIGLTCGLSSALEGYLHLTSEELQTTTSQMSYGFGAKFRFPGTVPVLRKVALWGESTFSDMNDQNVPTIYPTKANRLGVSASLDSNGFHPSLFFGGNQLKSIVTPMAGAGFTIALGHKAQMGLEGLWGYLEKGSAQAALTGSVRLISNISLRVSPGYLTTTSVKGWMISAGLSFSSADVDYHQVRDDDAGKDNFVLPTIDELEAQPQPEKKQ